jgi:hypothetical protein
MDDSVTAMMGIEVVVLIEKAAGADPWCHTTLCRMVKADQLALHHAAIHHLVVVVAPHQIGKEFDLLFMTERGGF